MWWAVSCQCYAKQERSGSHPNLGNSIPAFVKLKSHLEALIDGNLKLHGQFLHNSPDDIERNKG